MTEKALEYIGVHDFEGEDRMFFKVSYHRPHSPYDPLRRLFDKYFNGSVPERAVNGARWDGVHYKTVMDQADWRVTRGRTSTETPGLVT